MAVNMDSFVFLLIVCVTSRAPKPWILFAVIVISYKYFVAVTIFVETKPEPAMRNVLVNAEDSFQLFSII